MAKDKDPAKDIPRDALQEHEKDDDKARHAAGATGMGPVRKSPDTSDKRAAAAASRLASRSPANGAVAEGRAERLAPRRRRYLFSVRPFGAIAQQFPTAPPQSVDAIVDYLNRREDIDVVARMKTATAHSFAPTDDAAQEIVIARVAEVEAERLRASAQADVVVERDGLLGAAGGAAIPTRSALDTTEILPISPVTRELALRAVDELEQPLRRAAVVAYGSGFPVQAFSDETGTAKVRLFGAEDDPVRAIYVRPAANYWERFIVAPELEESGPTTIKLRPLTETLPNFVTERSVRWDQRVMRFDQANDLTGAGVRIAIIDSGCDNTHSSLRHITRGKDFTGSRRDEGWTEDALGYGTHSAALIAAAADGGQGIAGCAPEAEVHILKVVPGGRASDLIAALDECIAREIDVVCLNASWGEESELVARKLGEARQKGIACIAAASHGATAGFGPFAAALPAVLVVGAVGKLRTFPPDSGHARAVVQESIGADGMFPAAFTGLGVNVAVGAPGVAVVSAVPGGYAALDGTGVAAALVTGMAALVLAHHPHFQRAMNARTAQRVDTLFNLIRASAVPRFVDPLRSGAGVPDLLRVPGLFADRLRTVPASGGVFDDSYSAADMTARGGAPIAALDPRLAAWPRLGPAWAMGPGQWGLWSNMRGAGLL